MIKKIIFVIGDLDRGGAEYHLSQLLPLLKENEINPYVYTLTHKGMLSEELENKGISVKEPPYRKQIKTLPIIVSKPLIAIITFITLWIHIKRIHPDVVHFFLPHAYILGGFCSLFTPGSKRIMSRRSLSIYSDNRPFIRFLEKMLHKRMDILLGNSKAVIQQLEEECTNHNKIKLIYNGVSLNRFNKNKSQKKTKKELGISGDCLVISMLANIIPYKGHKDLLQAISMINKSTRSEYVFLCVGRDDGEGNSLRLMAGEMGISDKIRWLGERKDIPDILCNSDIGINCSHQEGFSNSILESMAASLPMVVTDVGGNKEAVTDGICGIVVPAHDPAALSEAIIQLMENDDKRRIMGKAARNRVEEKFSQEICLNHYLELYEAIS